MFLKPTVHSNTRNRIYIKVLSFILQRSHLLIFDIVTFRRSTSSTGCTPPCCSSVNGVVFLKQPLFVDEAGFSAAVIGSHFYPPDHAGSCFHVVHHDEKLSTFLRKRCDVCLNIAHAECAIFRFLTYLVYKKSHIFFFLSYLLLRNKPSKNRNSDLFFSSVK